MDKPIKSTANKNQSNNTVKDILDSDINNVTSNTATEDTIAAIATPSGAGGVGIIRISGAQSLNIAKQLTNKTPKPRYVCYADFTDNSGKLLDTGLLLYFQAPHSYTGEDVIEIQCHGGIYVVNSVLARVTELGAKLARAGEFTERAFLNAKIDLFQAEAVADLIDSRSRQAAMAAVKSLSGEFSRYINDYSAKIIYLRTFIEASLDFSDEEIDFLGEEKIFAQLIDLQKHIQATIEKANYGKRLQKGVNVVLIGNPNVGKSSLLNQMLGHDRAIVTEQAGTTRDTLEETISIHGIPVNIVDTAGLRETTDLIELAGIKRTKQAIVKADLAIWLRDINNLDLAITDNDINVELQDLDYIEVRNKIDLLGNEQLPIVQKNEAQNGTATIVNISAKTNKGIAELLEVIADKIGAKQNEENVFSARERHIEALKASQQHINHAISLVDNNAIELVAEELRLAQNSLAEITGQYYTDDLLGAIFSSFCIGK